MHNPKNTFFESPLSSSKESSLALQKDLFLTPVSEIVPFYKNSIIPTDYPLSYVGKTSGDKRNNKGKKSISHVIDLELLAKQEFLTAKIQDFQKKVRTHMNHKYTQNHKVIIFEEDDIVTIHIPKKNQAAKDYNRAVVIIKSIPHERQYQIQTKFGILDRLYST